MKIAIMQPYFLPYIGYFQLIGSVEKFVVYDNIEFSKGGWFQRNRLILDNKVDYFTINVKKDSDYLHVKDRMISPVYFEKEMPRILRRINLSYKNAPNYEANLALVEKVFSHKEDNLFDYIYNSIVEIKKHLKIKTEIIISSHLPIDHSLKNKWKIFEICKYFNSTKYINPIGGQAIYTKSEFKDEQIDIYFLKTGDVTYNQNHSPFIPNLSIIDVLLNNSNPDVSELLMKYELI